jgi:hypothetical protein
MYAQGALNSSRLPNRCAQGQAECHETAPASHQKNCPRRPRGPAGGRRPFYRREPLLALLLRPGNCPPIAPLPTAA